uniref:uncharacterized protein LOC122594011 n=1 Tax=Erigeron canadensis TaxID=72917 RepID=UPI001CB8AF71|nr:uncharacterized protein LOC122594011 [Erigeron canadensis]
MKFLHSPSSTSSSSTPEPRLNSATNGCFPTLLRRLLGFNTFQTLPFDHHIKEFSSSNEFEDKGNPGIVAKLMGLDSMPTELGFKKKGRNVHKAPSFIELENDKFIILSFEGGGKDKELGLLNCSKTRKSLIEIKEKSRNQEKPICQSIVNDGEVMNSFKLLDKKCVKSEKSVKKMVEKDELECDSENSSPVSVLEFQDYQHGSHSVTEDSILKNLNSRRKLGADLDKNAPPSPTIGYNLVDYGIESSRNGQRYVLPKTSGFRIGDFKELWEEICIMAERDMMDSSRLERERWKGEDLEEIGVSLELEILDQLILELSTIT